MKDKQCLIFAHRGASSYEKDNTYQAFDLAISQGADFIELDVRHTKEGILVVLHKKHIRKGIRRYRVSQLTFGQLNKFHSDIVTLEDIFKRFVGRVNFDLDIKELRDYQPLLSLMSKYHLNEDKVLLNCNKLKAINFLQKVLPGYRYVLSYSPSGSVDISQRKFVQTVVSALSHKVKKILPQRFKRKAIKAGVYGVSLPYTIIYQGLVDFFHQHRLQVYAWPPENEESLKKLIEFGVDGIKTGRPDVLAHLLQQTSVS